MITGTKNVVYPGTHNGVGAGFTAKVDNNTANKTYTINYTVKATVTLLDGDTGLEETAFKFPVKWRLYKVTSKVDSDQIVSCNAVKTEEDPGTHNVEYSQECSEHSSFQGQALVKSGAINPEGGEQTVSPGDSLELTEGTKAEITYSDTVDVSTADSNVYYYLVVEYTQYDQDQNEDMKKQIKLEISDIDVTSTTEKTD